MKLPRLTSTALAALETEGEAELRALMERLEDGRDRLAVEAGLRAILALQLSVVRLRRASRG